MLRASRLAIVPLALAAALSGGCVDHPYIRAAGEYGDATKEGAAALDTVTTTASRLCRTKSQMQYLQVRLGVLDADHKVPFLDYYDAGLATDGRTWKAYCEDVDNAGRAFHGAVAGLAAYGASLAALAKAGNYDGAGIKSLAEGVGTITKGLGSAPAAAAIKPVGALLGKLAGEMVASYVDDSIKTHVAKADPIVQELLDAMDAYLKAVSKDLVDVTEADQHKALKSLESDLGLLEKADRSKPDPARENRAARLLDFYHLAAATAEDIRATRATVAGYTGVLKKLKDAHAALRSAAQASEHHTDDVKTALGEIADLIGQIAALQGALANKE